MGGVRQVRKVVCSAGRVAKIPIPGSDIGEWQVSRKVRKGQHLAGTNGVKGKICGQEDRIDPEVAAGHLNSRVSYARIIGQHQHLIKAGLAIEVGGVGQSRKIVDTAGWIIKQPENSPGDVVGVADLIPAFIADAGRLDREADAGHIATRRPPAPAAIFDDIDGIGEDRTAIRGSRFNIVLACSYCRVAGAIDANRIAIVIPLVAISCGGIQGIKAG